MSFLTSASIPSSKKLPLNLKELKGYSHALRMKAIVQHYTCHPAYPFPLRSKGCYPHCYLSNLSCLEHQLRGHETVKNEVTRFSTARAVHQPKLPHPLWVHSCVLAALLSLFHFLHIWRARRRWCGDLSVL